MYVYIFIYTCKNKHINTHIHICISTHILIYSSNFVCRNRTVIYFFRQCQSLYSDL